MRRKLEPWMIILLFLAVLVAYGMTSDYPPDYFDNFGLICFSVLFLIGVWGFKTKKETPDWMNFVIVIIALLGLVVDGKIVLGKYF